MVDDRYHKLTIIPMTLRASNDFIAKHHRHHKPVAGMKFAIGIIDEEGLLRGVAIVSRPISRHLDDGLTAEVSRTATDGVRNGNSCLYAAAWRVSRAMGYRKLITYTQEGESGVSLRAAGWISTKTLPPRKSWAEASVALRSIRDIEGSGGVQRYLWEINDG